MEIFNVVTKFGAWVGVLLRMGLYFHFHKLLFFVHHLQIFYDGPLKILSIITTTLNHDDGDFEFLIIL